MSHLFLSSDADALADRLIDQLGGERRDPFEPISLVVPNRFVQQWLKFRLARQWGVAINVRFTYLEQALWDALRELDPREPARPPELLDDERYSLLVLSILWGESDASLAPLQAYIGDQTGPRARTACRRAWSLSRLLGRLIRDYEYHRQDAIVQSWLHGEPADVPAAWSDREAAQREVFRRVTAEPDGRRVRLNRERSRNFKTLPQYVSEFFHELKDYRKAKRRVFHFFGLSSMSLLHVRAIELLSRFHDCRLYHVNPLASRLPSQSEVALRSLAQSIRGDASEADPVRMWGRAAGESLHLMADFLLDPKFKASIVSPPRANSSDTVLSRVQRLIASESLPSTPLKQDASLQIVRCPGVWREAETIHAAILGLLDGDPNLRQTDIAVLVTDMDAYRPALTAVFERPPRRLSYGLADYTAAGVSAYGQAVVGMIDLALENLSRTRVFEVLLNPCVLARFGVDRDAALHWLVWAEALGIRHGWNAAEKRTEGYAESPLYSWKYGLQKLRMGQYMTVAAEEGGGATPAVRWEEVLPFADVESGDRERIGAFCRVVEGLLPMLVALRGRTASASDWRDAILELMRRYLTVPDDRPEEEPIRDALIESLDRFRDWDALHESATAKLPLALVREFIVGRLRDIPGRRHDVVSSGVTIAALKPQRAPFEVIFLAGMDEELFPGSSGGSPFDLRTTKRIAGDILPVEQQRFAFLEAIASARQKVIITSNARNLQTDEERPLAVPAAQLRRFVSGRILGGREFETIDVPLLGHDAAYLDPVPGHCDVLVQERSVDRVLSVDRAVAEGRLKLAPNDEALLRPVREPAAPSATVASAPAARRDATVTLRWMKRFLENPAAAAKQFHLHLSSEWDEDSEVDHEPLTSAKYAGNLLVRRLLESVVWQAETESLEEALAGWPAALEAKYREETLRGRFPEGAFAVADADVLREGVRSSLGDGGLSEFLDRCRAKTSCGPLLVGESSTPIGAKRRLPALEVAPVRPLPNVEENVVRIVGSWQHVWEDTESIDLLAFEIGSDEKGFGRRMFEPLLFALLLAATGEVKGRRVTLHRMGKAITLFELDPVSLDPAKAREYLAELATDCLDGAAAEQLPFKAVVSDKLQGVYTDGESADLRERLLRRWREHEEDREWGHNETETVELQDMGFRVPEDAYEKLRRRLCPLFRILPSADPDADEGESPAPKPPKKPRKKNTNPKGGAA